jgi:hypothetical protein
MGYMAVIRAVNTIDAMTATIERIDYDILEKIVDRITAEVPSINRVVYEITKKPVATIEFEVVKGLAPNIFHVQALPDLMQGTTTFVLTHDRPENEVEVSIEVFDMSGRVLWNHSEYTVSSDNTYTFSWNQCGASGQPLGEGVYLFRIVASSPSGSMASKAQKMVVVR